MTDLDGERVSPLGEHLDVLFVDLPFTTYELGHRFKSAWRYRTTLTPYELHLGFRYMVAALRAVGYRADILYPSPALGVTDRRQLVQAISEISPGIVGFTTYEGSLRELLQVIRRVKARRPAPLVVLGGHLATFSYAEILADFPNLVDVVVLGEGEHAIVEIADAVRARAGGVTGPGGAGGAGSTERVPRPEQRAAWFSEIAGIAFHDGQAVVRTRPRPVHRDLDSLPFPVVDASDSRRDPDIPLFITSSRGCYAHCSFCRSSHFGERWRARDPVRVVDEIARACAEGVRVFEFVDDNFMGPGRRGKRRAQAVAEEILRRGLDIRFHVSCRVNDVDEATIRTLAEAGLVSLSLGVESGVQRILDTFNKKIRVAQTVEALDLLNRLGVPTLAYIIFFDPYTTLAEARENLAFLVSLRRFEHVRFEDVIFRRLIPVSGTELYDRLRRDGLLRGDYLSGHHFVFRDRRVAILADFLEAVDLRVERAFQRQAFRDIGGLYTTVKESFEFDLAARAIELLATARGSRAALEVRLDELLRDELRRVFGTARAVA
jgi:radical SAM superfamily enzyme YgiQ (UPF0313 family)